MWRSEDSYGELVLSIYLCFTGLRTKRCYPLAISLILLIQFLSLACFCCGHVSQLVLPETQKWTGQNSTPGDSSLSVNTYQECGFQALGRPL